MNRQTRRDFFTSSVAGVAGLVLTGALPKEEYVPGCCPLIPFNQLKKYDPKTDKTYVVLDNESEYECIYVDTDETCVRFMSFDKGYISDDFYCPIMEKELITLETFDKNISKESIYKYLVINNKGEYGFLGSDSVCWNFRPSNNMPLYAKVENLRKIV